MDPIKDLREHFTGIVRLKYIAFLLEWDMQVYMPSGASQGRGEQSALLEGIIHQKLVSDKTAEIIKKAEGVSNPNLIDVAMLREAKRDYDRAVRVPLELVKEIAKTTTLGYKTWEKARAKSDFKMFKPLLEKLVSLKQQEADKIDIGPTRYDTMLDQFEPGAKSDWVLKIFNDLKPHLFRIIKKLDSSSNKPNQEILKKFYDPEKQWDFSVEVLKKLNYSFEFGRQDKSTHPFTTSLSSTDTRITTRIWENFLPACLFGTIHECGHALYEMGFDKEIHDTILADGTSLGIHESQSRLWENMVGRSREFWRYWYPILQKYFPENLKKFPEEEFYRSINSVQPSLIRVEADEVTYSLHIILRYEIEKELIEESIMVSELPQLWNQKMEELLGIIPPDDAKGVLQDVHWSGGGFGYFPTYALGNLYGAQIYSKALEKHPILPEEFEKGEFSTLLSYLRENIHQYGKIYEPHDLLKKVTGEDLNSKYFIEYLERKFYPIYKI